jgi:hypothetical protein
MAMASNQNKCPKFEPMGRFSQQAFCFREGRTAAVRSEASFASGRGRKGTQRGIMRIGILEAILGEVIPPIALASRRKCTSGRPGSSLLCYKDTARRGGARQIEERK